MLKILKTIKYRNPKTGEFEALPAIKGEKGASAYIAYSANPDGTGYLKTWIPGMYYIGIATGVSEPINKTGYTWVLLPQGEQGEPGSSTNHDADISQLWATIETLTARVNAIQSCTCGGNSGGDSGDSGGSGEDPGDSGGSGEDPGGNDHTHDYTYGADDNYHTCSCGEYRNHDNVEPYYRILNERYHSYGWKCETCGYLKITGTFDHSYTLKNGTECICGHKTEDRCEGEYSYYASDDFGNLYKCNICGNVITEAENMSGGAGPHPPHTHDFTHDHDSSTHTCICGEFESHGPFEDIVAEFSPELSDDINLEYSDSNYYKYHATGAKCTTCGYEHYNGYGPHTRGDIHYEKVDGTNHTEIADCSDCGATLSGVLISHSYDYDNNTRCICGHSVTCDGYIIEHPTLAGWYKCEACGATFDYAEYQNGDTAHTAHVHSYNYFINDEYHMCSCGEQENHEYSSSLKGGTECTTCGYSRACDGSFEYIGPYRYKCNKCGYVVTTEDITSSDLPEYHVSQVTA